MDITGGEYEKMTKKASPPSKKVRNGCFAFLIGGLICAIGEGLSMLYEKLGLGADDVKLLVPVTLIVAAAVLTTIGVFDKIASYAGAGTIVPIARNGVQERGQDTRHGRPDVSHCRPCACLRLCGCGYIRIDLLYSKEVSLCL